MDGTEIYPKNETSNGTEIHANISHVDYDYLRTLGIQILKGRNFSKDFPTDSSGIVINEAAVQQLGWTSDNAVGKTIVRSGQQEFKVVGVVADFNYASLKQKVAPLMMMLGGNFGGLIIKINTTDVKGFLSDLKKHWGSFNPAGPLEYNFLDEKFAALYASEQRTKQIFSAFAIVIIIAVWFVWSFRFCDGTFRAIRKMPGGICSAVLFMVSRIFVIGRNCFYHRFATWWAMNEWLKDFAWDKYWNGRFIAGGLSAI
jgi:putative ABC transport system permease protein